MTHGGPGSGAGLGRVRSAPSGLGRWLALVDGWPVADGPVRIAAAGPRGYCRVTRRRSGAQALEQARMLGPVRQGPVRQAGTTTYCRRHRSWKVTGPRGPGTWSTLMPVSGTPRSLNPSSSRVVAFQNAPVPRYASRTYRR